MYKTKTTGSKIGFFTFSVFNDALHQDRVFGDALGDEQNPLRNTQPPHDRQLTDSLNTLNTTALHFIHRAPLTTNKDFYINIIH